jgi:hypothetical protein
MRVYVVTETATGAESFVRAKNLVGAIRAMANETFSCKPATTEQMFQAYKLGLQVLDAAPEADENEPLATDEEDDHE